MKNIAEKHNEPAPLSENATSDIVQDGEQLYRDFEIANRDFERARLTHEIARLRKGMDDFLQKENFHQGQIVVWKENMRNRKKPEYGQPAIVVDVLKVPLKDLSNPGAAYFNEPLDLVIGLFDEYGDWIVLHVDARCFVLLEEWAIQKGY